MKKIKSFIFSESKLAKGIFGFLVVGVFALAFGPNLYAQFMRQDGVAGWGYGYGYGYGNGSGFDSGTLYGYRIGGGSLTAYGYGYGYGYRASTDTTTVGSVAYQNIPAATMAAAVPTLFSVTGTPAAATALTAADNIAFTATNAAGTIQILIPTGTAVTNSAGTAFDATALTSSDKFSSITASTLTATASVQGAAEFGVSGDTLFFSAPITVKIPVSSTEGSTLNIRRSADSGSTWVTTGLTAASTDTCTSGVGSNTVSSAVVTGGYITIYTCRASYFATYSATSSSSSSSSTGGGGSSSSAACTSVTYGAYTAACFAGYQYRNIVSRTPDNCTLTAAQQEAAKKACSAVDEATSVTVTGEGLISGGSNTASFIALEKNLVKKINKALAKRLSGRILLQVENKGEAWYVNPVNQAKYFLGRPADAFAIMRKLGLGISNKSFDSYKGKAPAKLAGRILLKVEDLGKAYYVNPVDLKMHYLGRPADAFSVMRTLGLGVNNTNLRQISVEEVK